MELTKEEHPVQRNIKFRTLLSDFKQKKIPDFYRNSAFSLNFQGRMKYQISTTLFLLEISKI